MLGGKSIARDLGLAVLGAVLLSGAAPAQLVVSQRAAINDNYGVEVQQDGTSRRVFAATNKAAGREHILFNWNVDFGNTSMVSGESMAIMRTTDQNGGLIFEVVLNGDPVGNLRLRGQVLDGTATMVTPWVDVSGVHALAVEWKKGRGDGSLEFSVDHFAVGNFPAIDSDRTLLLVYYGAPSGMTGLTGWYAFDDVSIADFATQWPEDIAIWIEQPFNTGVP